MEKEIQPVQMTYGGRGKRGWDIKINETKLKETDEMEGRRRKSEKQGYRREEKEERRYKEGSY